MSSDYNHSSTLKRNELFSFIIEENNRQYLYNFTVIIMGDDQLGNNPTLIRTRSLHWRYNERDGVSNSRLTIVNSTVYSGAHQRKHQSSASLVFVWGIHRWPVNYPHKGPVMRKMFPFNDTNNTNHTLMINANRHDAHPEHFQRRNTLRGCMFGEKHMTDSVYDFRYDLGASTGSVAILGCWIFIRKCLGNSHEITRGKWITCKTAMVVTACVVYKHAVMWW